MKIIGLVLAMGRRAIPSVGIGLMVMAWPLWPGLALGWGAESGGTAVQPTSAPVTAPAAGRSAGSGDWPMWGGRPDRNMVSDEKCLPGVWDVTSGKNIKWKAALGTRTHGNIVVSGGKVFIGTNNEIPRNERVKGDKGVLMCFAEADGRFLWQATHDKLTPMQEHDWPDIGLCSAPCVVGDRLYYVSNNCRLICADTEGFLDGENDGPFKEEPFASPHDADLIWVLDMHKDLGVVPLYASASAPVVVGDLLFVGTSNGNNSEMSKVPAPDAPSLIAVNRHTGQVVWKDNSPGDRIVAGQWSSPACGVVHERLQVFYAGGDGWLYGFDALTGKPAWKFNCRQGEPASDEPNGDTLIATPVFHDNIIFIAIGRSPELGGGPGAIWAIDAARSGDVSGSALIWRLGGKDFGRCASTVAVRDGLLYAAEVDGYLNCLDAAGGKRHWRSDVKATIWSSPMVADGKVYLANEDGDVYVFRHGPKQEMLAVNKMNDTTSGTAVAADGTLFIATRTHLYAIAESDRAMAEPARHEAAAPTTQSAVASRPSPPAEVNTQHWPMFRGNTQLTGVATGPLAGKLELRWKHALPEGTESSAAIVDGTVFVGCDDGFLYALDLVSGKLLWKYETRAMIHSSPCVAGGRVFVGDMDGLFHAVDAGNGKRCWAFRAEGEIISSANHAGDRIVFGCYDGFVYCLTVDEGKLLWKSKTEGRVHGTAGIVDDKVLVAGCDSRFHIFNLENGASPAGLDIGSFSGASVAIRGPLAFVGTFNDQVLAVDWTGHRIVWSYSPGEQQSPFLSSAAVTDDLVVIGGRDKLIHALNRETGKVRWTFTTKGKVDSSPVIASHRVFVGSTDGTLYALDIKTGKEVWRFDAGSSFLASPAIGQGCLVIGAEDGIVYCFGSNGNGRR